MTEEIVDPEECKERVAERIAESDLTDTAYFHPVADGAKNSTVKHDDPENLSKDIPAGNYGICASTADTLVLVDIDDHKEGYDEDALAYAREELPETFTFDSAHGGEGRLYHVPPDEEGRLVAKRLKDEFDGTANVSAVSWGEIRSQNQYIVGAGSQLDAEGCTKDGCTDCVKPDGGRYTIKNDAPVATLPAELLVDILREDRDVDDAEEESNQRLSTEDSPVQSSGGGSENGDTSPYRAVDRLDAQRVAENTIVHAWNQDHSSGDGVEAFYPTWDPDCNGTANVVGEGGWRDTGGRGKGGPIEMAAIDCSDLNYDERVKPGDVTGADWRRAYEHLQDLGFDLPDLNPTALRNVEEIEEPSEASVALDAMLSMYENDPDRELKDGHKRKIWDTVAKVAEEDVEEFTGRVADVLGTSEQRVTDHVDRANHEEENGPILVEDGKTWYLAGTPRRKHELLNFELEVQSYLQMDRGPLRAQLRAALATGENFEKSVEPKVFNKKERFDDEILGESFGTKFNVPQIGEGKVYVQDLLDAIRMWVHRQDAPRRRGVRHMGLYDDEFVIPGQTLTDEGWTDNPETVYLEREIGPERRVDIPTERDEFGESAVATIAETLPFTRDIQRLLPVLGWFYAAPLRPVVEGFSESGEFNHLDVTGDTGSGKTATISYLWKCFGMAGEPFSVDSSAYAQLATFSSTNSIPLWFDEYKPSDIQGYKLDRFHDKYRKANRGAYAERGNSDRSTDSYKIQAPVVLSGEQAIQGTAERRRTIMTQFRSETTDPGTDTASAYKDLVGKAQLNDNDEVQIAEEAPDPSDHALAYYRFITGLDAERVRTLWYDSLEYAHAHLNQLGVTEGMDDLEIQGVQTVVFGFKIYREFAESVGADISKLPTLDDLDSALTYVVERIGPGGTRKSHADRFVELFGRAAVQDYVEEGTHYAVVHKGKPNEELRINLPRSFDRISKYAKDHDIESEDLLNDHGDYRDRFAELAEQPGTYVTGTKKYTPPVSNCTGIRTVVAMNSLDFDRQVLTDEIMPPIEEAEEDDGDGSDDGDGQGPSTESDGASTNPAAADGGQSDTRPEPGVDIQADAHYLADLLDGRGTLSKTEIRNKAKTEYDMNLGRAGKALGWALENTSLIESVGSDEYRAL